MQTLIGCIAIATGIITILGALIKVHSVLTRLETRDQSLKQEIREQQLEFQNLTDKLELLMNGLKERVEHVNTRLTGQWEKTSSTVNDIEGFLQKHSKYERRSRS